MEPITLGLFVLGVVVLIVGAESLVRGASRLAVAIGISPLVIGLTVVSYGTSAPELLVSVQAAAVNQPAIALGNIIGSNIVNVLFILGLSALVAPLVVSQQLVRLDVPLMIGVTVLVFALALDGHVDRLEGLLLFAGLIAYTFFTIWQSRREADEVREEYAHAYGQAGRDARSGFLANGALVVVGLVMLALGARLVVDGATAIARSAGVGELVIGLTVVALGTSLPELAASVVASLRGERDIAVGNVIGSNLFNIMGGLGLASIIAPDGVAVATAALRFDFPVMLAVAVACLPIFFTGCLIARWEGALFLAYYGAYVAYLLLATAEHEALPEFSLVMLAFVIPITTLTLLALGLRALGRGKC